MVSDELKPKVLLCMLGDKVSNLLVNLGEEELKDYESLKQVVLKEYAHSPPKICLENFRKAKRNSDETFSQFASRLTSMWLYYWKSYDDRERLNGMIVKREVLMVVGVNSPFGEKKSDYFSSRKNFDKGQVTEIKNSLVSPADQINILSGIVEKQEVDNKRLNVNKVSTEGDGIGRWDGSC
ncbi:uncharacterized protein TNCV_5084441 [Trichonephila clavipes]|nr:uncharacterized protein TNCV_5084441 [Trichonephila clavipes]